MDPHDCHKFKVIVRSFRDVAHMNKSEPDMSQFLHDGGAAGLQDYNTGTEAPASPVPTNNSSNNSNSNSKGIPPANKMKYASAPKMESAKFLKARGKTTFWQLTMRVDNEQACKLAVQHIETKRKELTALKMQQLQRILEHWASDKADSLTKDD